MAYDRQQGVPYTFRLEKDGTLWWKLTIRWPGDAGTYLYAGGPPPKGIADANGDTLTTVADVFYLINDLFAAGSPPK